MLAGLLLTSISTLTMRAALFQRKSRSGWLEELDGIREDALATPDGTVGEVVDAGDIWTDLRDGGEYSDPHEISSLYATDETPDLPSPRTAPAKPGRTRGRGKAKSQPEGDSAIAAAPLTSAEHLASPTIAEGEVSFEVPAEPAAAVSHPVPELELSSPTSAVEPPTLLDREPAWVQPAPHPIRPSEMWHPADLAPPSLGEEAPASVEERLHAADLDPASIPVAGAATGRDPFGSTAEGAAPWPGEAPIDPVHAQALEDELMAAASSAAAEDATVLPLDPTVPSEGGLVAGPVGRRVRRDRPPTARPRATELPQAPEVPAAAAVSLDAVTDPAPDLRPPDPDRSPLPEAPLPPAAVATPPTTASPSPAASPAAVPGDGVPAAVPAAGSASEVTPLVPTADGMVEVPGTIVRLGGARRAAAASTSTGVVVDLAEGWTWVAPGDGDALAVSVAVPTARAAIAPGSTALVVVEGDGSTFVFVAAGSVDLRRDGEGATLSRGAIAMLSPAGAAQVDQATDEELASDPIVAENLAADAEL